LHSAIKVCGFCDPIEMLQEGAIQIVLLIMVHLALMVYPFGPFVNGICKQDLSDRINYCGHAAL